MNVFAPFSTQVKGITEILRIEILVMSQVGGILMFDQDKLDDEVKSSVRFLCIGFPLFYHPFQSVFFVLYELLVNGW